MIVELTSKQLRIDNIHFLGDAKRFVKPNELWYGYLIKKEDYSKLEVKLFKVETPDFDTVLVKAICIGDEILSCDRLSLNEAMFITQGTSYTVKVPDKFGYIDEVHKKKYLSAPITGYWDYSGQPILLRK